jgi:hypothetical protein
VTKDLAPNADDGRFDLKVDQDVVKAGAADGDSGTKSGLVAGTYTVSEVAAASSPAQLSDYLTTIQCSGEGAAQNGTSQQVTVSVGEDVECTITNTRKGSIEVVKDLAPSADNGTFDLKVGQDVVKANAADGDSGTKAGLAPGTYTVSEAAGSASPTALSDYVSSIECSGEGTAAGTSQQVTVVAGENVECTITNTRKGSIKVTKDLVPDADEGRFDLKVDSDVVADEAGDGVSGTKTGLAPGTYTVSEVAGSTSPTPLSEYVPSVECSGEGTAAGTSQEVTVAAGENVECTITNARRARVPEAPTPPVIDSKCLRRPIIGFVRGTPIKRVVFFLDGEKIDRVSKKDQAGRYATRIERRDLGPGRHLLRAKVYFKKRVQRRPMMILKLWIRPCVSKKAPSEIKLTGPQAKRNQCPDQPFKAYVKSDTISKVRWLLNGEPVRTVRVGDGKQRYWLTIDPADLEPGDNTLEADVRFIRKSKLKPVLLEKLLPPCGRK